MGWVYVREWVCVCVLAHLHYGVATVGRLLKIIVRFCRILSLLKGSFAKETYNFEEPTNRSHPISLPRLSCMGWLRLVGSSKL